MTPCPAENHDLDSGARSDFEWFDTFGFPDVRGCPFVRVSTGQWSQVADEPPRNRYLSAFLLATNSDTFSVLSLDLSRGTWTNTSVPTPEHQRVGFEILNLRTEALALAKKLEAPQDKKDSRRRFGEPLAERGEVFTLAWGCWRQGLEQEAQRLYDQAKRIPSRNGRQEGEPNFRQSIEKDVGHAMMWRAILGFEDVSVSRPELLNQFEAILKNYPHSEHRDRARQTTEVLKRMIAEDEKHPQLKEEALAHLPLEARVGELIFRLRDQNGHQYDQPGWCNIFENWPELTNTPAHQLVNLGYAAVPQLIAALDSDTLSRSVGYHRDFYFSHTVLTVGDCAAQILRRITGKSFFAAKSTYSYMSKDGQSSATRRAAEAWWAEFQKKGEQQMLVEAVVAPGYDAPAQAEMLARKYPAAAITALIKGAQATTNSWIRAALVKQIAKQGASGKEFLKSELEDGPTLQSRVEAAFGLRSQGEAVALSTMIREWQQARTKADSHDGDWEQVVEFIASCDSVEGVVALGKNLRQRPPEMKLKVIEALGETNGWFHPKETLSRPTLEAIEEVLVSELEDTEERMGMTGSRYGQSFTDPRMCDMAGCLLAERWPDRYGFALSGSLKTRDRQRIECANVWRSSRNLSPLPLPPVRSIRVGPDEAAKVTMIEWSSNSLKPDGAGAFGSRIAKLKDKPLNPDELVHLFADFARRPQPGAAGLEFKAIKDEDLTGVRLVVTLIPGTSPTDREGWDRNERVVLGRKNLHNSSGGGTLEASADSSHWGDFAAAAKQAIAGAPETPFLISVRLLAGKSLTH